MFKEVINAVKRGPTTFQSLAEELDTTPERIKSIILLLEEMGIVEEVNGGCEKSPSCALCPLAKSCSRLSYKVFRLKRG